MDEDASRYLQQEVDAAMDDDAADIMCRCEYCATRLGYAPTAVRLTWLVEKVDIGEQYSCYYEFFCAKCHALNQHALGPNIGVVLQDSGCNVRRIEVPQEVTEHRRKAADAPALTEADLVTFLQNLAIYV